MSIVAGACPPESARYQAGVIFVERAAILQRGFSGEMLSEIRVTSDGTRCFWVVIATGRPRDQQIETLAHEFQHVLESLEEIDGTHAVGRMAEEFFRRTHATNVSETNAAIEVGPRLWLHLASKPTV
jgi:hypothetical protein